MVSRGRLISEKKPHRLSCFCLTLFAQHYYSNKCFDVLFRLTKFDIFIYQLSFERDIQSLCALSRFSVALNPINAAPVTLRSSYLTHVTMGRRYRHPTICTSPQIHASCELCFYAVERISVTYMSH